MREIAKGDSARTFVQNHPEGAVLLLTARWCGSPCDSLVPVLALIEAENPSISVAVADLETARDLAAELDVTGIPAVLGFVNGKCVAKSTSWRDKASIEQGLEEVLRREA